MNRVLMLVVALAVIIAAGCGGGGGDGGGGGGGNRAPVIASLTPAQQAIWPAGTTQVTCNASDADGDNLTFNWTAPDGGTITGSGATVTFTAPLVAANGVCGVRCEVSDGRGGGDVETVNITVGATVRGRIVSAVTAEPVPGVQVMIDGLTGFTDATGTFSISGVGEGTHRLQEGPQEQVYTIAGLVQIEVTAPGTTVQFNGNIQVFSGPPPPPF